MEIITEPWRSCLSISLTYSLVFDEKISKFRWFPQITHRETSHRHRDIWKRLAKKRFMIFRLIFLLSCYSLLAFMFLLLCKRHGKELLESTFRICDCMLKRLGKIISPVLRLHNRFSVIHAHHLRFHFPHFVPQPSLLKYFFLYLFLSRCQSIQFWACCRIEKFERWRVLCFFTLCSSKDFSASRSLAWRTLNKFVC